MCGLPAGESDVSPGVAAAATRGCGVIRWLVSLVVGEPPDLVVDDLIARNKATSLDGMSEVDWRAIERAGQRRWQETVQAQRRQNRPVLVERRRA